MIVLWIVLVIVIAFVLSVAVAAAMGARLPEEHVASATLRVKKPPDEVWALVSDMAGHPHWAPGVTKVERLPDRDGREVWRQHMGRNSFVLETAVCEPPRRLSRVITDDNGPFSGRWDYEIEPDGEGARLTITEYGRIKGGIPRFVMRYLMGEAAFIRKHLGGVARRMGEPVVMT